MTKKEYKNCIVYDFSVEDEAIRAVFFKPDKSANIKTGVPFNLLFGKTVNPDSTSFPTMGADVDEPLVSDLPLIINELKAVVIDFKNMYNQDLVVNYIAIGDEDVSVKASVFNTELEEIYGSKEKISETEEIYLFKL